MLNGPAVGRVSAGRHFFVHIAVAASKYERATLVDAR